jgi:hypothetical protein
MAFRGDMERDQPMTVIGCTRKLLTELRIKPDPAADQDERGWHANLLRVEGHGCVLFTHDETLYSFLVCRPNWPDLEHFSAVFGQGLFKSLLRSGFSQGEVEYMLDTTRELHFAKTTDRRVLGSMNNMAQMLDWTIGSRGGLAAADPADLQRLLNDSPFKAIGYETPIRCLRRKLASAKVS